MLELVSLMEVVPFRAIDPIDPLGYLSPTQILGGPALIAVLTIFPFDKNSLGGHLLVPSGTD